MPSTSQPSASAAPAHLPVDLLRQYVAGVLPPAEQHRVEAHTLGCSRCADVLEGLTVSSAAATDLALSQLQDRLHARIAAGSKKPTGLAWQPMAAVVALLLLLGGGFWLLHTPAEQDRVAVQVSRSAPPAPATETAPAPPDAAPTEAGAVPDTAKPALPTVADKVVAYQRARPARRPRAVSPQMVPAPEAELAASTSAQAVSENTEPASINPDALADAPPATPAPTASAPAGAPPAPLARKAKATSEESPALVKRDQMPAAPSVPPLPAGGYKALREHLRRLPAVDLSDSHLPPLMGSVKLRFTVTETGALRNIQVIKSLRPDYDAEAMERLCSGPAWQPGIANGRLSELPVELSISF
ncbi:zf-HC2 domain-containing protein [Hymenobacter sp. BT175]|uniref:zf-HC2 domain-containing protein n=1 Tax=Hymenobacter translucens TaxID=2886507 RepID=UPI001D0F23A1|nr:zf-HC2 domain-containing protein [Hymenobacter translucens]MCC2545708.1 zf-HC2 domain-containing protein [Hymenobacter translucens]